MRDFHRATLLRAEMKHLLQLLGLAGTLRAEERERRIRGHHGALIARQQIAWVLGREHQRSVVFADAPGETDHETADRGVLEKKAQLVDHEHAPAVLSLDVGPQSLSE